MSRVIATKSPNSFPKYHFICSPPHSNILHNGIRVKKHTGIDESRFELCFLLYKTTLTRKRQSMRPSVVDVLEMRRPGDWKDNNEHDVKSFIGSAKRSLRHLCESIFRLTHTTSQTPLSSCPRRCAFLLAFWCPDPIRETCRVGPGKAV